MGQMTASHGWGDSEARLLRELGTGQYLQGRKGPPFRRNKYQGLTILKWGMASKGATGAMGVALG